MEKLKLLISEFKNRLPQGVYEEIDSYSRHNEWGLALEELCNFLYEYNVSIAMHEYEQIVRLARSMKLNEQTYDFLKELIR